MNTSFFGKVDRYMHARKIAEQIKLLKCDHRVNSGVAALHSILFVR
jgi:hypothetical protein